SGVGVLVTWPAGALLGAVLGNLVADPAVLGLDAALPALLGALALPALRARATAAAALLGTATALAVAPFVPAGVPVLLALVGVAATLRAGLPAWEPAHPREEAVA
ncbi:MAG: branched-chain amino acid ABC transporter permease, partial [Gordonia sp. (in: high G+C Gram-positive bacteria)]